MTTPAGTAGRRPDGVTAATASRRLPWWLPIVASAAATYGVWRLRLVAMTACDVGLNASTRFMDVTFAGINLLLVNLVALSALRLLPHRGAAAALGVLVLVVTAFVFLGLSGPPADYPSDVADCTGNIPSWWPTWLPT
jgi:hypothetical protein